MRSLIICENEAQIIWKEKEKHLIFQILKDVKKIDIFEMKFYSYILIFTIIIFFQQIIISYFIYQWLLYSFTVRYKVQSLFVKRNEYNNEFSNINHQVIDGNDECETHPLIKYLFCVER